MAFGPAWMMAIVGRTRAVSRARWCGLARARQGFAPFGRRYAPLTRPARDRWRVLRVTGRRMPPAGFGAPDAIWESDQEQGHSGTPTGRGNTIRAYFAT